MAKLLFQDPWAKELILTCLDTPRDQVLNGTCFSSRKTQKDRKTLTKIMILNRTCLRICMELSKGLPLSRRKAPWDQKNLICTDPLLFSLKQFPMVRTLSCDEEPGNHPGLTHLSLRMLNRVWPDLPLNVTHLTLYREFLSSLVKVPRTLQELTLLNQSPFRGQLPWPKALEEAPEFRALLVPHKLDLVFFDVKTENNPHFQVCQASLVSPQNSLIVPKTLEGLEIQSTLDFEPVCHTGLKYFKRTCDRDFWMHANNLLWMNSESLPFPNLTCLVLGVHCWQLNLSHMKSLARLDLFDSVINNLTLPADHELDWIKINEHQCPLFQGIPIQKACIQTLDLDIQLQDLQAMFLDLDLNTFLNGTQILIPELGPRVQGVRLLYHGPRPEVSMKTEVPLSLVAL